jgi:3D (Asp-Asp-Asp) domain-containing protein
MLGACVAVWLTAHVEAGQQPRRGIRLMVSATAYCIAGETRSGIQTRKGILAADPRVLPLGTVVHVQGLRGGYNGTYTVADTGKAVKGREIDIFIADCRAAKRFGRQEARLRIVRRAVPESGRASVKP